MMEWYQIVFYFLTNGIRIYLCLRLVAALLKFPVAKKSTFLLSLGGTVIITALSCFISPQFYLLGIEIIFLLMIVRYLFQHKMRLCLFVIIFYEIAVALWDFLISAGFGVLLHSNRFVEDSTTEYLIAVLVVRLLLVVIAVLLYKKNNISSNGMFRLTSAVALLGMFGIISLSEQSSISLSDNRLTTWIILSLMLIMAVLFFNLSRQYEMEKEIARLKAEQTELLERDFQTLNSTYSANAKLFHDLHNHIEILHRFLVQEKTADALHYLDDFHMPMQEITQTIWTGDEATDYLINSKIALAEQQKIQTHINIEFPRHTNIRSADLTAILGNLLDNALEATLNSPVNPHFIHLTIRRINDMLIIKVENDCKKISLGSNENLQTTKSDSGLHGWGLKSARTAAERYDGTVETTYTDNLFRAVVTLSYSCSQIE